MSVKIVVYVDRYFAGVDALWREAFPNDTPRNRAEAAIPIKLAIQPDMLLVAVEGDRVVGSVVAGFDGYRGWLNRVAVLQSHRRHGIATKLIREAEARLALLGCAKINLQINGANKAVEAFYAQLGYSVEDRISMGKSIRDHD